MIRYRSTKEASPSSDSFFDPQRVLLSPSVRDHGDCANLVRHINTRVGASTRRPDELMPRTDAPTKKNYTDVILDNSSAMLVPKLVGDFAIAAVVTAAVAPALTVVDKALVERSAVASNTILHSAQQSVLGMIRHPVAYFQSPTFLWMWLTYGSTYAAANSLRTLMEHQDFQKAAKIQTAPEDAMEDRKSRATSATAPPSSAMTLFVGTTIVNSSASLVKDRAYAKLFGNAISTSVPRVSYGLWIARDCTIVASSFVLPPIVARCIQEHNILPSFSAEQSLRLAQIVTPATAQLVAGPLHFVGLDWFNRPSSTNVSLLERARFLQKGFAEVVSARIARIIPGYGLAGVWNQDLRNAWRQHVMDHCTANNADKNHRWWLMEPKPRAMQIELVCGISLHRHHRPKQPPVLLATTSTGSSS
jgi:hypothetical protein